MMKKITSSIFLFFTLLSTSFYAQDAGTLYYEDFRYENESRGFTVQNVSDGGQSADEIGKRVGDVVDAVDSNGLFVESSRPSLRIPSGATREQRAISFRNTSVANDVVSNHEIEAWAMMTNQDLSGVNDPSVSFWTEQRDVIGGGAVLTILVSEDYTHGNLPSTATWTDETANIVGSIATSDVAPLKYVKGSLDLSAYSGSSVTVAFKVVTDGAAYEKDIMVHGAFYISDVYFQKSRETVANGTFSPFNTSASGQQGIFDIPSASISDANFTNLSKWNNLFSTETSVPRLALTLIPSGEGYKFVVADDYNPIAVSEVTYKLANGASHKGTDGYASQWIVQGSEDDFTWDDLCDPIIMLSANTGVEVTLPLTTTQAYRYYRFVLVNQWEPNSAYTALNQLNFKVDDTVVVAKENVADGLISDANESTTGQINIFNEPTAAQSNDNFTQNTSWANLFLDNSDADPRFAESLIPIGEGYQFQVASNYNPISISKLSYEIANGASNKGKNENDEAIGSSWVVQGSNDATNWDDLSDTFRLFTSNSTAEIQMTSSGSYRYFRLVLTEAWKPDSAFTALRHFNFTVGSASLSVTSNEVESVTIFPNPVTNLLHINNSNSISIDSVQLFDVKGKLIYSSFNGDSIDVTSFKSGLYILKISFEGGAIAAKKVIVN